VEHGGAAILNAHYSGTLGLVGYTFPMRLLGHMATTEEIRPGIMPSLFGRHLIGSSLFISLQDMASELPDLDEYVSEGACELDQDIQLEYDRIAHDLKGACKDLLKTGSMKLLGAMLYTLLDYPDMPFDEEWVPDHEGDMAVGYYVKPRDFSQENWVGVVQPRGQDRNRVFPKEQKLIDICRAEKEAGNQCWVYVTMTQKRNVRPRLKRLLEEAGLKVAVLDSNKVKPVDREEWIARNGPLCDVIISHAKPVSTGLEFFDKDNHKHNFNGGLGLKACVATVKGFSL